MPQSQPKPPTYKRPSVEVTVYLSRAEAARAKTAAAAEARSVSGYLRSLLLSRTPPRPASS